MPSIDLDAPISDTAPHIFKRPILHVSATDSLTQVGTFLAIGPQIYVDGLLVLEGEKPVGTIGGQHLIRHILLRPDSWFQSTAAQIMGQTPSMAKASDTLAAALKIFAKTKFAFLPITVDGRVTASLSLRDILRVAAGVDLDMSVAAIGSQLIAVKPNTSIKSALNLMLAKGIRNLAVRNKSRRGDYTSVVNDRKILEFILSHEGRKTEHRDLEAVKIGVLDALPAKYVKDEMKATAAAELLSGVDLPCLLIQGDLIVTPWDIMIKGLYNR